jgi:hypothetical protein
VISLVFAPAGYRSSAAYVVVVRDENISPRLVCAPGVCINQRDTCRPE